MRIIQSGAPLPDRFQIIDVAQVLIIRYERNTAKECGRRNHSVGWVSGELIPELTGPLGDLSSERLDAIFRQPSHLGEPF